MPEESCAPANLCPCAEERLCNLGNMMLIKWTVDHKWSPGRHLPVASCSSNGKTSADSLTENSPWEWKLRTLLALLLQWRWDVLILISLDIFNLQCAMLWEKPSEANPNETQTRSSSRTPPWHLWRRRALPTRSQPPPGHSCAQPTSRSALAAEASPAPDLGGASRRGRQCGGRPWGGGDGRCAAGRAAQRQHPARAAVP